MICPHCQKENFNELATVCVHCNKPLNVAPEITEEPVIDTAQPSVKTNEQQSQQSVIYCSHCGSPCDPMAAVCVKCGFTLNNNKGKKIEIDEVEPSLKWISLLIPLVGLILYITKIQSAPNSAKEYGKMALIGVIIGVVAIPVLGVLSEIYWYFC